MLLGGVVAIAHAPILAELARAHGQLPPSATAFWRMALATPLLFAALAALRSRPGVRPAARWRWTLLVPGVFFAGDLATWHLSFVYTSVANATLLANVSAILVPAAAWFLLRERVGRRFALGAGLAFLGVAILLGASGTGRGPATARPLLGDAIALVTAAFYAGYLLSMKGLRARHGALRIWAWSSAAGALCLLALCLVQGAALLPAVPGGWWSLLGLAVVPHCLGQGLIAAALGRLPAGSTAVALLAQPVITAALGWIYLGQEVVALQAIGGGVVLLGIALAQAERARTDRPRT